MNTLTSPETLLLCMDILSVHENQKLILIDC